MRRQRPCKRPPHIGSAGYSLVEVVVAMLISVVMVTAVMSVAVTAKQGSAKAMHHMMMDQGVAQVSAMVKQYVTACGCNACTGVCPSPQCADPGISGPNTAPGVTGANQWYFSGSKITDWTKVPPPSGTGVPQAVWPLASGDHYLTGVVPSLEAAPYIGYIKYSVGWPNIGGACTVGNGGIPGVSDAPEVKFMANWSEP